MHDLMSILTRVYEILLTVLRCFRDITFSCSERQAAREHPGKVIFELLMTYALTYSSKQSCTCPNSQRPNSPNLIMP